MAASAVSMQTPSVAGKISAVRQRYEAARKQLRDSESEELQRLQQECGALGHRWKWHQVAGDGRYCEVCDAQDSADD